MARAVFLDFETRSACELKTCGAFVYSQHPTTEIVCLYWRVVDGAVVGPMQSWKTNIERGGPPDPTPQALLGEVAAGSWFVAHNVLFERSIWAHVCARVWGWPEPTEYQWFDTMACAARKAAPLDLEDACRALGLPVQKDTEGSVALRQICKPAKKGEWNEDPALYQRVYDYCPIDVDASIGLLGRVGRLTPAELDVWRLNQRMNWKGLRLDMAFVADCQAVVDEAMPPLEVAFRDLTGLKATQRAKVLAWITERYPGFPNMTKEVVEEAMKDWPLPDDVRTALELRSALTSTSLSKLESMRRCVSEDGRARGLSQYHGATTGREAGRLLQPYNFPRGTVEYGVDEEGNEVTPWETSVPLIQSRSAGLVGSVFAASEGKRGVSPAYQHLTAPVAAVSSSLRHCIVAAPGHALVAGDFSTIEARVCLAIAGQDDVLTKWKHDLKYDPYCEMASMVLGRTITKKENKKERQEVGKPTVLGCGFQMGWRKFHARYMKKEPVELAQKCVDTYRQDWAPRVPELWRDLEEAAIRTVWDRKSYETHGVTYAIEDEWLSCRLPSGRKIYYLHPRACRKEMPWSTPEKPDIRKAWRYTVKKMGVMSHVDAYGGLLTENVVQATARDLLVDRALVAEKEGFPLVLTVYDEIVTETEECRADPKALQQIMEDAPTWAKALGIPVAAEVWAGERYRK